MHGLGLGVFLQPVAEGMSRSKLSAMQLRIAAWQPDKICIRCWCFICKWGKGQDLGSGLAPTFQKMWIGKGKRRITGQGDTLRWGRWQRGGHGLRACQGSRFDGFKVHMGAQKFCIARDGVFQIRMFNRLDQAKMAFGQCQIATPGQGPKYFDASALHAQTGQSLMAGACNPVQNHTCKWQIRLIGFETQCRGCRRLRLPAHIDHQHNRPAHAFGRFRR